MNDENEREEEGELNCCWCGEDGSLNKESEMRFIHMVMLANFTLLVVWGFVVVLFSLEV